MTGHFDNKEQFDKMQTEGKTYPYANTSIQHVTIKSKISQKTSMVTFVVEESYYETDGKSHASPLFFLFQKIEGIVLSSYWYSDGEVRIHFLMIL